MNVLVLTGTAGPFPRLVAAMEAYQARHPQAEVFIQWGHLDRAVSCAGTDFLPREQVLTRMTAADVVVCHAGSGTIRDAVSRGHVPVLVPRLNSLQEHVDDHQLDIARAMRDAGRALWPDLDELDSTLQQAQAARRAPGESADGRLATAITAAVEELGHHPGKRRRLPRWLQRLGSAVPVRRL